MSSAIANWPAHFKEDELFLTAWLREGKPIPRIGIFIVTYNHVSILPQTLKRIPQTVLDIVKEIFIFDDASRDDTYLVAEGFKKVFGMEKLTIRKHERNLGYGGNQKAGYDYAIRCGLEYVVLLHGDGQYAPEALPSMIRPILEKDAKVVFGSRMLVPGEARRGGMPFYKFIGNRILTGYENVLLGMKMSEYHSGYRLYSTEVLKKIPFTLNSDDFHFDTEIIVQVHELGQDILEIPMPSYYGEEICYVNGIKYAWNIVRTMLEYKLSKYGLREDPRFNATSEQYPYELKKHPLSSHMQIVGLVPEGSTVLDLGCGTGTLLPFLKARNCVVSGIDFLAPAEVSQDFTEYHKADLDCIERLPYKDESFDAVIMADLLEHVKVPGLLLAETSRVLRKNGILIASTGNIALFLYRFLLFFGSFPYSKKGILDHTHVHLYTLTSFFSLLNSSGFTINHTSGTPIPFDLIFRGDTGKTMTFLYYPLVKLWKSLFAYQFIITCSKNIYHKLYEEHSASE